MHARRIAPRRPIPPAPGFTRRHRRIAVRCAATIADGRRAVPGETMDVGGGGAAFLVDAWIPPFTPVSVLLRPPGAPEFA